MPDIKRYLSKISESKSKSKTSNSIYYHLANGVIRLSDHFSNNNTYTINIVIINQDVCVIKSSMLEIHCYYAEAYDYLKSLIYLYPHLDTIKDTIKSKNDLITLRNNKINELTQEIKNIKEQYHNKDFEELLNEAIEDAEKYKREAAATKVVCTDEINKYKGIMGTYKQKVLALHDMVHSLMSANNSKYIKIQAACKDLMKSYT